MRLQTLTFGIPHTYILEKLLYKTNYSQVYEAYDETADRTVCIKQIDLQVFSGIDTNEDPLKIIRKEIHAMTLIGNETPHIPCLMDSFFDENTGIYSIVMQLCKGDDLRAKMTSLTPSETFLRYMMDLCGVLARMHEAHLYHKDIKPENIRIAKDDTLILLDFNTALSAPNLYEGTPGYRAPEMEIGDLTADRSRVDTFAVGLLLYEFYAQEHPRNGSHYYADVKKQCWGDFLLPSECRKALPIPAGLEGVIMQCLSYRPKDRYDIRTLQQKLQCILRTETECKIRKRIQKNI